MIKESNENMANKPMLDDEQLQYLKVETYCLSRALVDLVDAFNSTAAIIVKPGKSGYTTFDRFERLTEKKPIHMLIAKAIYSASIPFINCAGDDSIVDGEIERRKLLIREVIASLFTPNVRIRFINEYDKYEFAYKWSQIRDVIRAYERVSSFDDFKCDSSYVERFPVMKYDLFSVNSDGNN